MGVVGIIKDDLVAPEAQACVGSVAIAHDHVGGARVARVLPRDRGEIDVCQRTSLVDG
jgi:hypothetical protein